MPPYTKDHQPPRWFATAFPYLVYGGALATTVTLYATTPRGVQPLCAYVLVGLLLGGVYACFGIGHTPPKR